MSNVHKLPNNLGKIEIEDGIPMPKAKGRGREKLYPFDDLKVGQSFFVQFSGSNYACLNSCRASVKSIVSRNSRSSGKKFETRSVEDGVRVWRTK